MPPSTPSHQLRELTTDQSLELLASDVVGRLGIVGPDGPLILPVNYVVSGLTVVFRTAPGAKLSAGRHMPACFEVDQIDRATSTGWSVVAQGPLEALTERDEELMARLRELPPEPWAAGPKDHWMRLLIAQVTGRRIGPLPAG